MKARPILFSEPMILAMLAGIKTQTRRIVKPAFGAKWPIVNLAVHGDPRGGYSGHFNDSASWGYPHAEDGADMQLSMWLNLCPYGAPGDLLWCREAFDAIYPQDPRYNAGKPIEIDYRATPTRRMKDVHGLRRWKPSIHMPRSASRLTLEITDVRVQRLQDISNEDTVAEGIGTRPYFPYAAIDCYKSLWESINGPGSWALNPWVWALTFNVHRCNIESLMPKEAAA